MGRGIPRHGDTPVNLEMRNSGIRDGDQHVPFLRRRRLKPAGFAHWSHLQRVCVKYPPPHTFCIAGTETEFPK